MKKLVSVLVLLVGVFAFALLLGSCSSEKANHEVPNQGETVLGIQDIGLPPLPPVCYGY